ncbi:MAG TPA: NuoF family protein [Bryobacteraceae bacterium]|nr:NuoF family protein [Bryobacteraceae bacterium]
MRFRRNPRMQFEELKTIAEQERDTAAARTACINVCAAASCQALQSEELKKALTLAAAAQGYGAEACTVRQVGCLGLCGAGPLVSVDHGGKSGEILYQRVQPADAEEIIAALDGPGVERLRLDSGMPFFTRQHRIVLENSGRIDPDRLEDYIAQDGYLALHTVLHEMQPAEVIAEVAKSGLRGRGGAGYPTGLKWETVAKAAGSPKTVVCNADEGDPGAFMDRSVLESDPHRVIEGMAIAAYAVGASEGYIYVRAEYPLAVARLKTALRHAERQGLLGGDICGSHFTFRISIRLGAGAFVCGEETALLASIQGLRGTPKPRPPYPAQSGLFGHPTLINNVETYANIAPIIRRGGDWFSGLGTERSKGTKVFALAGSIQNTGLIEVPMGMTLRDIVFDIGGGIPGGKGFKAVQTGGPSGGCIPAGHLDTPVDYETLTSLGSIMGSGGMIVMDESSSMVDVARYFMEFCMTESCGKCIPCRAGTVQMHELLGKFCDRRARVQDLQMLETLCDLVRNTSLCGLGQSAPNPVMSTLRYFRPEYEAAIAADGGLA